MTLKISFTKHRLKFPTLNQRKVTATSNFLVQIVPACAFIDDGKYNILIKPQVQWIEVMTWRLFPPVTTTRLMVQERVLGGDNGSVFLSYFQSFPWNQVVENPFTLKAVKQSTCLRLFVTSIWKSTIEAPC